MRSVCVLKHNFVRSFSFLLASHDSCFSLFLKLIIVLIFLYSLFKKRNNDGKAALHLALESKLNVRAVSLLKLEKGMSFANKSCHKNQYFLADGCYIVDPNYPDGDGKNAIHIATAQGLPVELLLQR